jgi:hypothetical protein
MPVSAPATLGRTLRVPEVDAATRDAMYRLLAEHFADADRATFEVDLEGKDFVILLEDASGAVAGFSTFEARPRATPHGDALVVYSGDTIVRVQNRHQTELPRHFISLAMRLADESALPTWWLLICSGYKTYRYLPLFFREFHPSLDASTQHLATLADALASDRFGPRYDPATGTVCIPGATTLRAGIADVDARRMRDPVVRRFCELNPGHVRGDELVCVVRLDRENLTRAGARMMGTQQ